MTGKNVDLADKDNETAIFSMQKGISVRQDQSTSSSSMIEQELTVNIKEHLTTEDFVLHMERLSRISIPLVSLYRSQKHMVVNDPSQKIVDAQIFYTTRLTRELSNLQ